MLNLLEYLPEPESEAGLAEVDESITLESGEEIRVEKYPEGQRVRILTPGGQLLLEYDPRHKDAQITIPDGDLKFATPRGNIDLEAAGRVKVTGREVEIATSGFSPDTRSALSLRPGKLRLAGNLVNIVANRGELAIKQAELIGERFKGTVKHAKLIAGKVETLADMVRAKAKNVFETVENLRQSRAGRMQNVVESEYQLTADMIYERAKKDVKIDGEQIYLG